MEELGRSALTTMGARLHTPYAIIATQLSAIQGEAVPRHLRILDPAEARRRTLMLYSGEGKYDREQVI